MGNVPLHTLTHPIDEVFFHFPAMFMRTEPLEVSGYPSSGIHYWMIDHPNIIPSNKKPWIQPGF